MTVAMAICLTVALVGVSVYSACVVLHNKDEPDPGENHVIAVVGVLGFFAFALGVLAALLTAIWSAVA